MTVHSLTDTYNGMSQGKKTLIAGMLLSLLSLAAYSNSFNASFQFDDYRQIVWNEAVRNPDNIPRFFTDAGLASALQQLRSYRPLTLSSFAVNYALGGYDVRGYHVFNYLLHSMNALLVFVVVSEVLKGMGRESGMAVPFAAASLFALHPIETAAVTYISGRAVLLASVFFLLAFYVFLRARRLSVDGLHAGAFLVPVFFLLGLLSKEMAVSLPVIMLLYEVLAVYPVMGNSDGWRRRRVWVYVAVLAVCTCFIVLKGRLQGSLTGSDEGYRVFEYLMSQSKALLLYARLMLLPVNQNADYYMPVTWSPDVLVGVSILLIAAYMYLLYRLSVKDRASAFFGLWFLVALAPESSLVPIADIAVEHRLYLPSVGLLAALTALAARQDIKPASLKKAAALIALLLMTLTLNRNTVWATPMTFWSDAAKKAPHSPRAHLNLGDLMMEEGRYKHAIAQFTRTLEENPDYIKAYNDSGLCYMYMGRYDEALQNFETAVEVFPGYAEAYRNMGLTYFRMGRYKDAVAPLEKALRIMPSLADARRYLALSNERLGLKGSDSQSLTP